MPPPALHHAPGDHRAGSRRRVGAPQTSPGELDAILYRPESDEGKNGPTPPRAGVLPILVKPEVYKGVTHEFFGTGLTVENFAGEQLKQSLASNEKTEAE